MGNSAEGLVKQSALLEILSQISKSFPNTITATLFVLGIMLGKIAWICIAGGAIVLILVVGVFQKLFGSLTTEEYNVPGAAAVSACSIIPPNSILEASFSNIPSTWMSVTFFYLTYIVMNALTVYNTKPTKAHGDSITVQHRKSMGTLSIITTVILLICMVFMRYFLWGTCESIIGTLVGGSMGVGMGILWWQLLAACGPDVYPDIHGVMVGLKPRAMY
jgi:hypothetical protein